MSMLYDNVVEALISMKAKRMFSVRQLELSVGFENMSQAKEIIVQRGYSFLRDQLNDYPYLVFIIKYYFDDDLYVPVSYSCITEKNEVTKEKLYFEPEIHLPATKKMYVVNDRNYKWHLVNDMGFAMIVASEG